jgi:hypothetical protein
METSMQRQRLEQVNLWLKDLLEPFQRPLKVPIQQKYLDHLPSLLVVNADFTIGPMIQAIKHLQTFDFRQNSNLTLTSEPIS